MTCFIECLSAHEAEWRHKIYICLYIPLDKFDNNKDMKNTTFGIAPLLNGS